MKLRFICMLIYIFFNIINIIFKMIILIFIDKNLGGEILNEKQKKFCDYYLEFSDITKAAIKAGYSKNTVSKLLKDSKIKEYLDNQIKEFDDDKIAKPQEVIKYLTKVMRGEEEIEFDLEKNSLINKMGVKGISTKERLKAAELLGKTYDIFSSKQELREPYTVIINGEDKIGD